MRDVTAETVEWVPGIDPGGRSAVDELIPTLYAEMRRIAASLLRHERQGHTLQPTAVVNEAYVRLVSGPARSLDRETFLRLASQVMRLILVDHGRKRRALKRGGLAHRVTLGDGSAISAGQPDFDVLDLDAALGKLRTARPEWVELVLLRYFGGLTAEEIAKIRGVSSRMVFTDLLAAKTWLRRELSRGGEK